jgi:hypothetical protein
VASGSIVRKKAPKKLNFAKWKRGCGDTFAKLGYSSIDKFFDDVRGPATQTCSQNPEGLIQKLSCQVAPGAMVCRPL